MISTILAYLELELMLISPAVICLMIMYLFELINHYGEES